MVAYTMMPHNDRPPGSTMAMGSRPSHSPDAAPCLRRTLAVVQRPRRQWLQERWAACGMYDHTVQATRRGTALGYLFQGAGHDLHAKRLETIERGPGILRLRTSVAGHGEDDEGHFLISNAGPMVSRQADRAITIRTYYAGGSLIFNIVTIFDPNEKFRRRTGITRTRRAPPACLRERNLPPRTGPGHRF